ncbi:uncharacterized protein TNCV_518741 [Trichonephila clavipes]|nr:uncharacterized protein TNCV_518741 [Trichonephila clavipes]
MLFQNDIPIDVAYHHYTLNMQVSSGTKDNSSPNEPFCTTVTVSFNCVCSLGGNGYLALSILKSGENQTVNETWTRRRENITQDHCCGVHNACSLLQVNRRRQGVAVNGTHLTGLRAYRPMCPKRLYKVCLVKLSYR